MCLVVRPAIARRHQPQIGQTEIGHGTGGKANILTKLRPDQHDRGLLHHGRGNRGRTLDAFTLTALAFYFHGGTML